MTRTHTLKQIQTKCGDLVAFTSGGENPHAVMPTLAGNRLNIQTWWNVKDSAFRSCMNVMEMTEGVSDVCSGGSTNSMCIVGSGECARFVRSDCRETRDGKRVRCMVRIKPYVVFEREAREFLIISHFRVSITSEEYHSHRSLIPQERITRKNQRSNTNSIMTKTELALRARTQVHVCRNDCWFHVLVSIVSFGLSENTKATGQR